jgi:DNA repair protein RadC
MSDLSTPTDEVHMIREIRLNYSRARRLRAPLSDCDAVVSFLRRVVSDTTREHAVAIYLDPKNRPLGWRTVSIGTDVMAPVKPLLVLQPAVLLGANALIFAHNHPAGDLEPSPEDKNLAQTLCQACKLLGLRLLDNIIWTDVGSTSYGPYARESGGVR